MKKSSDVSQRNVITIDEPKKDNGRLIARERIKLTLLVFALTSLLAFPAGMATNSFLTSLTTEPKKIRQITVFKEREKDPNEAWRQQEKITQEAEKSLTKDFLNSSRKCGAVY